MDERERRRRKDRERRADEAFYDGLLLGHYFWRERDGNPVTGREVDPWQDDAWDDDEEVLVEDLDMFDDWD